MRIARVIYISGVNVSLSKLIPKSPPKSSSPKSLKKIN